MSGATRRATLLPTSHTFDPGVAALPTSRSESPKPGQACYPRAARPSSPPAYPGHQHHSPMSRFDWGPAQIRRQLRTPQMACSRNSRPRCTLAPKRAPSTSSDLPPVAETSQTLLRDSCCLRRPPGTARGSQQGEGSGSHGGLQFPALMWRPKGATPLNEGKLCSKKKNSQGGTPSQRLQHHERQLALTATPRGPAHEHEATRIEFCFIA